MFSVIHPTLVQLLCNPEALNFPRLLEERFHSTTVQNTNAPEHPPNLQEMCLGGDHRDLTSPYAKAPENHPGDSPPGRGRAHPGFGSSGCVRGRTKPTAASGKCMIVQQLLPARRGPARPGLPRPRYDPRKPAVTHPSKEREAPGHAGGSDAKLRPGRAAPPAAAAGASPAAPSGAGSGPLALPGSAELLPPLEAARSGQLPLRRLLKALTDLSATGAGGKRPDPARLGPPSPGGAGRGGEGGTAGASAAPPPP